MENTKTHPAQSILAALFATALIAVAGVAIADDPEVHIEREFKVLVDGDAEAIEVDIDDMEVGETRQHFTDSGKEVLITKTEDGHTLEIDGKTIEIGGEGHAFHAHSFGHENAKVIVKRFDSEEGFHFIHANGDEVTVDVDEDFQWVQGDEAKAFHVLHLGDHGAAQRLEASGVLDDLSDEKRQQILDALRSAGDHEGTRIEKRLMMIEIDDEDDE